MQFAKALSRRSAGVHRPAVCPGGLRDEYALLAVLSIAEDRGSTDPHWLKHLGLIWRSRTVEFDGNSVVPKQLMCAAQHFFGANSARLPELYVRSMANTG